MEVKITLGAAQDVEKWSKNSSGGPPAKTGKTNFAPGGFQEASGTDLFSKIKKIEGARGGLDPPGGHFAPRLAFGLIFNVFWGDSLRVVFALGGALFV